MPTYKGQVRGQLRRQFADLHPEKRDEWLALITKAVEAIRSSEDPGKAISEAERIMSPIARRQGSSPSTA